MNADIEAHAAYIQSPTWARRRDRYLGAYGRRCRACGSNRTIQVHHLTYVRAFDGQELDLDLMALCDQHHELAHCFERSGKFGEYRQGDTLYLSTMAMIDYVKHPPPAPPQPQRVSLWTGLLHELWQRLTGRNQ